MNLASLVTASDRPALRDDDGATSYRALDDAAARLAALLRSRGVGPGDRVGLMLPNVAEFAVAYYGILRAGAIVVPMNVMLTAREAAYHVGDAGARVVLAWHACARAAEDAGADCVLLAPGELARLLRTVDAAGAAHERDDADTAVILYTSGTTGTPKGAELSHANLAHNARTIGRLHGYGADTVALAALPLFHAFGQTGVLNAALFAGGTVSLLERFDARRALHAVERDRVTVLRGVPAMYVAMLDVLAREDHDVSSLRICVSGGAAMPVELLHATERAFGCRVLEGYGLSETSPVAACNPPDRERRAGSIGVPIDGVEMKLLDERDGVGEIAVRGPNVMKGYWNRPEATAEVLDAEGWLRTGDLARVDADGYFFIVDRKKDVILRGGYNVYPREVEEVLLEHPAVHEAAVLGVPHARLGEEVAAALHVEPGTDLAEVDAFVRERVAAYKRPRTMLALDEMPRGPTGKILKRRLAERFVGPTSGAGANFSHSPADTPQAAR